MLKPLLIFVFVSGELLNNMTFLLFFFNISIKLSSISMSSSLQRVEITIKSD